ncbi:putative leucine-rich repeat-containing protein DDB_G0290503 isoform X2 [Prorops nasuta]|uniref:putative leucine-rich repeat-containing protein DDB_G0290503 isoform X2 n=1 Tax=Prorops nasuta TaxID=863751 RepID=UPI0034CF1F1F
MSAFRHNFRARIDLSQYYDDSRKYSFVLVQSSRMGSVEGLKKHITKLFNIEEPFDLMHNGTTYLPPNEDIEIVYPSESIIVQPKQNLYKDSLCDHKAAISQNGLSCSEKEIEKSVNSASQVIQEKILNRQNKEVQVNISTKEMSTVRLNNGSTLMEIDDSRFKFNFKRKYEVDEAETNSEADISKSASLNSNINKSKSFKKHESSVEELNKSQAKPNEDLFIDNKLNKDIINTDTTMYYSFVQESENGSSINSKTMESTVTGDNTFETSDCLLKRKRIRRKKQKKHQETECNNSTKEEHKSMKPKIINSLILSSGKHIRFDSQQINENPEQPSNIFNKTDPSKDLLTLLELRNSSTPITFTNKKHLKNKAPSGEIEKTKWKQKIESSINETLSETELQASKNNKKSSVDDIDATETPSTTDIDEDMIKHIDNLPILTSRVHLHDIIAFKMLKMGVDYTPQASKFIIGKVISTCPEKLTTTFKIIRGKNEVQLPIGKFTLPEDESTVVEDTITLNDAQLITPRVMS